MSKLFHLSPYSLDGKVLRPRVPKNILPGEDNHVRRVCFAETVWGCVMGINNMGLYHVHVPVDYAGEIVPPEKLAESVPDAYLTREFWLTSPVRLRCIGRIWSNVVYDPEDEDLPIEVPIRSGVAAEMRQIFWVEPDICFDRAYEQDLRDDGRWQRLMPQSAGGISA